MVPSERRGRVAAIFHRVATIALGTQSLSIVRLAFVHRCSQRGVLERVDITEEQPGGRRQVNEFRDDDLGVTIPFD